MSYKGEEVEALTTGSVLALQNRSQVNNVLWCFRLGEADQKAILVKKLERVQRAAPISP